MTDIYLGLDLGTIVGWAVMGASGRLLASGSTKLNQKGYEGAGVRYIRFFGLLGALHEKYGPIHLVGYEEVRRHQGTTAAHVYGGMQGAMGMWCERNQVPYTGFPVGTIKKAATGNGNAGKGAMIAAAETRHGISVGDDNEADAIHIVDLARVHASNFGREALNDEE